MHDITCIPEATDQSYKDDGMTICPFCWSKEHNPPCEYCFGTGEISRADFLAWLRGEYDEELEELP
ncbi:MAG: hypothetical protein AMJ93_14085 [Anaerolineae bacterium SM23_84]|nr:MAG: hypothetical protein AMJ93_14085 [Anaerolineae bacterium SM23_84]